MINKDVFLFLTLLNSENVVILSQNNDKLFQGQFPILRIHT